jgi:hypothetical protein
VHFGCHKRDNMEFRECCQVDIQLDHQVDIKVDVSRIIHNNNMDTYIWVESGQVWVYETGIHKSLVFKRDRTTLCVSNTPTNLGSLVNMIGGEDPHDHLMDRRIFALSMTKIFIRAPKIKRQMARDTMWSCLPSCMNCVFRIIWEVDVGKQTCI